LSGVERALRLRLCMDHGLLTALLLLPPRKALQVQ
jgi:hypothetical protein